jgi:hypothetical protein
MKHLSVRRLCLAVMPVVAVVAVFAAAASADVGGVSFSGVTSSGFTVDAVESDVAGCGPEYVYVATDPLGANIVDFADPISADPVTGAFSASFGGLSPGTTYYLDVGDYICNDVFPNVSTLAAAVTSAKPAPIPQPPGRYLLCDPAKGSMNLQDTQVAGEIAAGGTFASWVDGKDKNGNYIGLTCDPPSSYGAVKDTGTKVGPNGKTTGPSTPNTGQGTDNVYEMFVFANA